MVFDGLFVSVVFVMLFVVFVMMVIMFIVMVIVVVMMFSKLLGLIVLRLGDGVSLFDAINHLEDTL